MSGPVIFWMLFGCLFLLPTGKLQAQDSLLLDSLQNELQLAQTDSSRQFWLHRLTWHNIVNNSEAAADYNVHARALAFSRGDSLGIGRYHHYAGLIDRFSGSYANAIHHLKAAIVKYEAENFHNGIAGAFFNLGVVYSTIGDYEQSLRYYYRAIEINEEYGRAVDVADALNSIGSVHRKMGNYDKALQKYEKALDIFRRNDKSWNVIMVMSNMGGLYMEMGLYEKADPLFRQTLAYGRETNDLWGTGYSLHRLGVLKQNQGGLDSAAYFLQQAADVRREMNLKLEYAESLAALGAVLFEQGKRSEAIDLLNESLEISRSIGALEAQTEVHELLAGFYREQDELDKALDHLTTFAFLRDSATNVEKQRISQDLEARYESAKKDQQLVENKLQLASNQAQIQRQRLLIQISAAGVFALLIVLFSFFLVYRSRRRLNEQKLRNLQKEKELVALKSMMVGEEKERERIARELHDGLSSFLAAIKIQFSTIQQESGNFRSNEKYDAAMQRLDEANKEVRRIAHNMMPEILMKYGMDVALAEFVAGLNSASGLHVEFSHFGMEERLPSGVELVLYRVVQELLSNVIKHSRASEVLVQLNRRGNQLNITVEDNGVGFDEAVMTDSKGMGIQNLTSRIQYLNGSLQFESSAESGTSVYIEVELDKIPEAV